MFHEKALPAFMNLQAPAGKYRSDENLQIGYPVGASSRSPAP